MYFAKVFYYEKNFRSLSKGVLELIRFCIRNLSNEVFEIGEIL